jgi:hypothetical protein
MRSKENITLLKGIVESDFILLEQNLVKNSNYFDSRVNLTGSGATVSLNLFQLVKSLKQFVRLLQFLKSQDKNHLHVLVENKQYLNFLNQFFNDTKLNCPITITNSLVLDKNLSGTAGLLLLLDKPLNNNKNLFKRFLNHELFLISKVNSTVETNNWSSYKIYNDLADFKKVIFLISLIRGVLLKL